MNLKNTALALCLTAALPGALLAQKNAPPAHPIPHIDHVFVIMMENHAYSEIFPNANAPFINSYAITVNSASNYYGVGHPSLTNYLETVGGSNFGVVNDNSPDWHNTTCVSNISLNAPALEGAPNICPIAGAGLDAATPAVDTTNEGSPDSLVYNDPYAPAQTVSETIADQLVAAGKTWKSYQENLPPYGADWVNNSDGLISNITAPEPGMPKLYAVKHNPFVYFKNIQDGTNPSLSLKQIVGFDRLWADIKGNSIPNFSYIVPNQCHDQHGRGASEMGTGCNVDQNDIAQGDAALKTIISTIKSAPFWSHGNNVIVTVWDENDYGTEPNQVVMLVDNNWGLHGVTSNVKYNHFSLLKSIEAGFNLPYLNHAADSTTPLMTDLFARH